MHGKIGERIFFVTVAGALGGAALVKLLSSSIEMPIHARMDPIFHVHFLTLWRIGAVIDFLVFWASFASRIRHLAVALCGGLFLCYHATILWFDLPQTCPCLGRASEWTGVGEETLQKISAALSVYMLLGASYFTVSRLRDGKSS
jgi:hypothetical protein